MKIENNFLVNDNGARIFTVGVIDPDCTILKNPNNPDALDEEHLRSVSMDIYRNYSDTIRELYDLDKSVEIHFVYGVNCTIPIPSDDEPVINSYAVWINNHLHIPNPFIDEFADTLYKKTHILTPANITQNMTGWWEMATPEQITKARRVNIYVYIPHFMLHKEEFIKQNPEWAKYEDAATLHHDHGKEISHQIISMISERFAKQIREYYKLPDGLKCIIACGAFDITFKNCPDIFCMVTDMIKPFKSGEIHFGPVCQSGTQIKYRF